MATKNFGKRLRMEESPMLNQTEQFMENEVLTDNNNISPSTVPPVIQSMMPVGNFAQRLTGMQKTKGLVIDMPIETYRKLRDMKDYLPGETLKSLALRAVVEFVERNIK